MATKEVKLPSGQKVKIRRPGLLGWRNIYAQAESLKGAPGFDDMMVAVVLACEASVEPKYHYEPDKPGHSYFDDLDAEDQAALIKEAWAHADMEGLAAKLAPLGRTVTSA